ncbi:hypothetical protein, partial [Paracoccus sp. (in: a-proteobacteria)]|uniref:hypothetical protein n=1 Tax=Paracoccus sp. TaxID=267 RepID=UPI00322012AD
MKALFAAAMLALTMTAAGAQEASVSGCGVAAGGNVRDTIVNCYDTSPEQEKIIALLQGIDRRLADQARQFGIQEKAIIELAQRIAPNTETFDQAQVELDRVVGIAIDVQRRGNAPSEAGPFVDEVLQQVAKLSRTGQHVDAAATVDEALAKLREAQAAMAVAQAELLEAGIKEDLLRGDTASAARRIVEKIDLTTPAEDRFARIWQEWDVWYTRGRDQGVNLDLEVAIELGRLALNRAQDADVRGAVQNNLGNALLSLGERESGTGRLEEAVVAYRAALEENTRARVPLDWAGTQNNLGNALLSLGERESGTGRLEEAVVAYRAAL